MKRCHRHWLESSSGLSFLMTINFTIDPIEYWGSVGGHEMGRRQDVLKRSTIASYKFIICLTVSYISCLSHATPTSQLNESTQSKDSSDLSAQTDSSTQSENLVREPAGVVDEALWPLFLRDISSPFRPEARPWFLSGVGLTSVAAIFKDEIGDPIQDEVSKHKPLGDASKIGDNLGQLAPNILYSAGMFAHYYFTKNDESARLGYLMAKASFYSGAVTTVLKYSIQQPRPYDRRIRNSFPSGHSTSAFAFAAVVGAEHGWKWGVPAYLMAAFVGFSRMNDNKHLLQDVLAGATIGIGYGIGLSSIDHDKEPKSFSARHRLQIFPILHPQVVGASLSAEF